MRDGQRQPLILMDISEKQRGEHGKADMLHEYNFSLYFILFFCLGAQVGEGVSLNIQIKSK